MEASQLLASEIETFWLRVVKTEDCWQWNGSKTTQGYGKFFSRGKVFYGRRVSYILAFGELPDDALLRNSCENKWCVNSLHLYVATSGTLKEIEHVSPDCTCGGKRCPACKHDLCQQKFYSLARSRDGLHFYCINCLSVKQAQWYVDNLEHRRQYDRKHNFKQYGLTEEDYSEMFEAQGGLCAICHRPSVYKRKNGAVIPLSIDHNHTTGEVRALLCSKCNGILAKVEDKSWMEPYEEYLSLHGKRERVG